MADAVAGRDKCGEPRLVSLPLSRIRVIMKSSPEVSSINQEALVLTAKATVRRTARGGRKGKGAARNRRAPPIELRRAARAPARPARRRLPLAGSRCARPPRLAPVPSLTARARRPARRAAPVLPRAAFAHPLVFPRCARGSRPPLRALRSSHRAAPVRLLAPFAYPLVSPCCVALATRSSRLPLRALRPAHRAVPALPRATRGLPRADAGLVRRLLHARHQTPGTAAFPSLAFGLFPAAQGSVRGLRGEPPDPATRAPLPAAGRGDPWLKVTLVL